MLTPNPPYGVAPIAFRFAALAALAGRAPIGGQREVALAIYVAAHLADDAAPGRELPQAMRAERATAARSWLSSLTLPPSVRQPIAKLLDASALDAGSVAEALREVLIVSDSYLDAGARAELSRLERALEAQTLVA